MNDPSILILAALPQEYAGLKRLTGPWERLSRKPFASFRLSVPGKEAVLVETGMGGHHAADALDWALAGRDPHLLVSLGFAGSLDPALNPGDVCIAARTSRVAAGLDGPEGELVLPIPAPLEMLCERLGIAKAFVLSADSPARKLDLSRKYHEPHSLIDMESAILAELARKRDLPFICLRAVSDGLHDRIGFDLAEIAGPDGRVRIGKVLRLAAQRPGVVANFYALWRRSSKAAANLGAAAAELLWLPAAELASIGKPQEA
jgi:adenosylhomocysteine nucleosidase